MYQKNAVYSDEDIKELSKSIDEEYQALTNEIEAEIAEIL